MSLRKRKNQLIRIHLDSKAARYGAKKKQIKQNRQRAQDYKEKVKKN